MIAALSQEPGFSGSFRTIKYNHLFMVDDIDGFIPTNNLGGLGFYYLDTRHISQFELFINDIKPMTLLSSTESTNVSTLVYTNNLIESCTHEHQTITVMEETMMVKREIVLNEAWFEKYTLVNYNEESVQINLKFRIGADFRDIFEVRAVGTATEGCVLSSTQLENKVIFHYADGLGDVLETQIIFENFKPVFNTLDDQFVEFYYETMLSPHEEQVLNIQILPISPGRKSIQVKLPTSFETATAQIQTSVKQWESSTTEFITDNEEFNDVLARCHKDIHMLVTASKDSQDDEEAFIAAGIPWFVALFGRDSIITSRSCLILKPDLAKATLKVLAKYQGKKVEAWRDEEPGKILHELRVGELARHGKIPHTPYYGSVDATPLWIILLYDYFLWTHDQELLETLWPNTLAAMSWIDTNLNQNPLGYLTYVCKSERGLYHQGWKDSNNSLMYGNGKQAEVPLYLVEVQGYVYLAKYRMAQLAEVLGNTELHLRLLSDCQLLKDRFNRDFWVESLQFPALALDAKGKPLDVVSSNPGHCLETGILKEEYIQPTVDRLMASDMFNGWGIRTLSSKTLVYNPMSYHNGSVWPHDNAMIAKGLAAVGRHDEVDRVFTSLFDVGRLMTLRRIPELFCGFSRDAEKGGQPPVKYPVACSPQAWAAASMFSLLQSLLNINSKGLGNGEQQALLIKNPRLPQWLNYILIRNLKVGKATLSLEFKRTEKTVLVNILERDGDLPIYLEI
jgi:glycogen debranching enzyme